MRRFLLGILVGVIVGGPPPDVGAQDVEALFQRIRSSVVVIKARVGVSPVSTRNA